MLEKSLNSFTSSVNSCVLPNFGVGVNFSPLFNNNISASVICAFSCLSFREYPLAQQKSVNGI